MSSQSLSAQNPISINYNATTQTVSVKVNPCDICILGGEQFVPFCECNKAAENSCKDVTFPQGANAKCIKDYIAKNCPNLPVSAKKIQSYNYGISFCYNKSGGRPTFNPPCVNTQGLFEDVSFINIPDWKPKDKSGQPFPELTSVCIYFHIAIFFENGESCHFKEQACFSQNY